MNSARFFKWIFKFKFSRKYYFGLYKKFFKPYRLFRGKSAICRYDENLKMKVDIDEWIQQHVYFFGVYDPVNINYVKSQLKTGDYFFDIGANVGCFSLTASRSVGEEGKVYSFEPVKKVYDRLNENIKLNELRNVTTVPKAVYQENTTLRFYIASQENLGMSSIREHDTMSGEVEEMEAISLDNYIRENNIGRADFIKMDIEGAEFFALKGMTETLRNLRPLLMIEISKNVLKDEAERLEIFRFFRNYDYEKYIISEEGKLISPPQDKLEKYTNFVFKAR